MLICFCKNIYLRYYWILFMFYFVIYNEKCENIFSQNKSLELNKKMVDAKSRHVETCIHTRQLIQLKQYNNN